MDHPAAVAQNEEVVRQPPTPDVERLPNNVEAVQRAINAIDLENADDVLEPLKCRICWELPLGKTILCPNGHGVCEECQLKTEKDTCTTCEVSMKTGTGGWIRNRPVEEYLDTLAYVCPFRNNGCQEILSKSELNNHKEQCVYNRNCIQLCKYFGHDCQYWIRISQPKVALQHIFDHDSMYRGLWKTIGFIDVSEENRDNDICEAIGTERNGDIFLTMVWTRRATNDVTFVCLQLNKPSEVQTQMKWCELTLISENKHTLELRIPIQFVLDPEAIRVIEEMPKSNTISKCFLKRHFFKKHNLPENILLVIAEIC